jgi:hypothetical protein
MSALFAQAGSGAGLWTGKEVTRTLPTSTLFISNVPEDTPPSAISSLFSNLSGFVACRSVRALYFIDFSSPTAATAAMRQRVGSLAAGKYEGIVIDFDKDSVAKRAAARTREARDVPFFCALCRMPVLYASAGARVDELPKRKMDGALVLFETPEGGAGAAAKTGDAAGARAALGTGTAGGAPRFTLVQCHAKPGEMVALRRDDGRVEKQYTLLCPSCGVRVAYRAAPRPAPSPYTYIYAGALTHTPRMDIPVAAVQSEVTALARRAQKRARVAADGGGLGPGAQDSEGAGGGEATTERDGGQTSEVAASGERSSGDSDEGALSLAVAATDFATARLAARFARVTGRDGTIA